MNDQMKDKYDFNPVAERVTRFIVFSFGFLLTLAVVVWILSYAVPVSENQTACWVGQTTIGAVNTSCLKDNIIGWMVRLAVLIPITIWAVFFTLKVMDYMNWDVLVENIHSDDGNNSPAILLGGVLLMAVIILTRIPYADFSAFLIYFVIRYASAWVMAIPATILVMRKLFGISSFSEFVMLMRRPYTDGVAWAAFIMMLIAAFLVTPG